MTNDGSVSRAGYGPVSLYLAAVMSLSALGCGNASAPTPEPSPQPAADVPATVPKSAAETATDTQSSPDNSADPKSKTKWVGGIPYDVFYDRPLQVAAESISLAPATVVENVPRTNPTETAPQESTTETPGGSASASGDGPDWQRLANVEVLNEEVKRLRNALTTNLNTLATYNRNIESIVNDGATLGALAAVVEVHPDRLSWSDNARYVRDLGYAISMKADGSGREPFEATKLPFEQIVGMLNGGPPPDIEAEEKVPFADIADRSELMKRIKKSFDYLKAEFNTQQRFQESPEDIIREASVLASIGGIISTSSYDSSDEEQYRQFVTDFIQANVDITAAAAEDDFARFETARDRVQNACNACHGEYAFGDEGF